MNWSGGRLRRHSRGQPDSLVRLQREHFDKASLKKRQAATRFAAAGLASPPNKQVKRLRPTEEKRKSGFVDDGFEEAPVTIDSNSSSPSVSQPGSRPPIVRQRVNRCGSERAILHSSIDTSQLEEIKRNLLQKPDWVGLSISRPLHMKFPRIEEKNMIGKRRRMSCGIKGRNQGLDRHSIKSPNNSTTAQSDSLQCATKGHSHTGCESPGSMLLDVDGAESERLLEFSSLDGDCQELSPPHNDLEDCAEHELVLHEFSPTDDCEDSITAHRYGDRNATVVHHDFQTQVRNRFTLDDQILEEKMEANGKRFLFMGAQHSEVGNWATYNPWSWKSDHNRSDVSPVFDSTDMDSKRRESSALEWPKSDCPEQTTKTPEQCIPASQEVNGYSQLVIFGQRISPPSAATPLQSSSHFQNFYDQKRNRGSDKSLDTSISEPSEISSQGLEQGRTHKSYLFAINIQGNTISRNLQHSGMTPEAHSEASVATPSSVRTSDTSLSRCPLHVRKTLGSHINAF